MRKEIILCTWASWFKVDKQKTFPNQTPSRFGSLCQNLKAEVTDYMVETRTYLMTDCSQGVLAFP